MSKTKKFVVLTDCDYEALYVDGVLALADTTIYACDIDKYADGRLIEFIHAEASLPADINEWPESLKDAIQYVDEGSRERVQKTLGESEASNG